MIQNKKSMLFALSFGIFSAWTTADESAEKEAVESLNFLVGTWHTESTWPENGEQAPGTLTYEWVLGGTWLKITFIGEHPTRPVWEAHGMIRYLPQKKRYEAIIFAGPDEPINLKGTILENGALRFEMENDGILSGIDYRPMGDGVYQENWTQEPGGSRVVRLKTTYSPISP